jgi:creatinine amidohydrolase
MDLPGTINVRLETLTAVVSDVCHSIHAHGFDRIVLLSGHGGNRGLLLVLVPRLQMEGVPVAGITYWDLIPAEMAALSETDDGKIGHAGEIETYLQMYLQPELVDQSVIEPRLATDVYGRYRKGPLGSGVTPFSRERDAPQGVFGDPTKGGAAKGAEIVAAAATALTRFMRAYIDL